MTANYFMNNKRVVVIGGGAAGVFCAVNVARMNPSLQVILLEKTTKLLSKVKVSGGGRCNVTHACFSIPDMLKHYPRGANFLKKAFQHFFTTDTIKWFEERNVLLKKEDDGRMFPVSNSSQTIIDCLVAEMNRYKVEVMMKSEVRSLRSEHGQFIIELSDFRLLTSDFVCVACGGYSKSAQFDWLRQQGHSIAEPVPSLFTFNMPGNAITQLMGVSVPDAIIKIVGQKLSSRGPLLITHWGLSGPAVLKLSAWGARELAVCNWQFAILVNWLPAFNEHTLKEKLQSVRFELGAQKVINRHPLGLPQRLWEYLLKESGIKETVRWADLPAKEQHKLIKCCCAQEFTVSGKTTFKDEFVTAGGIQLAEIDANSMQSKIVPHLFFAGEIMDVDGVTGGFNFQHAWTSGFIAASAIARESESQ